MSDAFLRVLNAPTGDDIAVARMWEQYDFDASEWDADRDSKTDSDVTVEYDWEADHDYNGNGNMLSNDNNAPIILTFSIDLEMVYTHNKSFGLKNRPFEWFVSATFHSSRRGFALEANVGVAALGRPKMTYPDIEKLIKIKILDGFDSFLCYLVPKTYGYICLAGSRKCVRSVIIWVQDTVLN